MDYDKCMELFRSSGFLYAEPLVIGTLSDMINFPLGFDSTIPVKLGLPPLPKQSNIAEGIVVKPLKNSVVESKEGKKRVIFKRKVDGFCERKPRRRVKEHPVFDHDNYQLLKYEMLALTTEQRVENTISKHGRPDEISGEEPGTKGPSWEDIHKALICDILAEIKMDEELWEKFNRIPKQQKAVLMTEIKEDCSEVIDNYKTTLQ